MIVALLFLVLAFVAAFAAATYFERPFIGKFAVYIHPIVRSGYPMRVVTGTELSRLPEGTGPAVFAKFVETDGDRIANGHFRIEALRAAGVSGSPTLDVHVARALRDNGLTLVEYEALPEDQRRGLRAAAKVLNFGEAFGVTVSRRPDTTPASQTSTKGPKLSTYAVHELIEEHIAQHSNGMRPSVVMVPSGHQIPEGQYELNEDGVWRRVRACDAHVPLRFEAVEPTESKLIVRGCLCVQCVRRFDAGGYRVVDRIEDAPGHKPYIVSVEAIEDIRDTFGAVPSREYGSDERLAQMRAAWGQ